MFDVNVGIIGGGIAGSLAAAMLGRAGISTALIDIHERYPEDFRAEKIQQRQIDLLVKTGLAPEIVAVGVPIDLSWIACKGRLVDKQPIRESGIAYSDLVNLTRSLIPPKVEFIHGKVSNLSTTPTQQIIELADGKQLSVRLVILATGLFPTLQVKLNIWRNEISKCHSISVGFDLKAKNRDDFDFPALTYISRNTKNRINYLTLRWLPVHRQLLGATQRANMFLYRDARDPWLSALRNHPEATMMAAMPRLTRLLGDFEVTSKLWIRSVDLYSVSNYLQPGLVLVGDIFSTSCPAAGTGIDKVLVDVERLCNVYVPQWLATPGMDIDKLADFYADPVKKANDARSLHLAYYLRSLTLSRELQWRVRRVGSFSLQSARGALRPIRRLVSRTLAKQRNQALRQSHGSASTATCELAGSETRMRDSRRDTEGEVQKA